MTWLFLTPGDVWLFRDGKPFSASEQHSAHSIFPPSPLTIQGVLRSHLGVVNGVRWGEYRSQQTPQARRAAELIGTPPTDDSPGTLGQFTMAGPYVAHAEDGMLYRYFPLPADIVISGDEQAQRVRDDVRCDQPPADTVISSGEQVEILQPMRLDNAIANWPLEGLYAPWTDLDVDDKKTRGRWLREDALYAYLQGKVPKTLYSASSLYKTESRFGIAIDPALGRVQEGMLYQAEFVRMEKDTGLLVEVPDGLFPEKGVLAIGGERRNAYYHTVEPEKVYAAHADWTGVSGTRLKLVFLTPAYFGGGWLPETGWSSFFTGADPTLVAVALKRPISLGGWDLARQEPRAIHHYVAPGSVFYFESDGPFQLAVNAVTETPPYLPDASRMGFGQVAVGLW